MKTWNKYEIPWRPAFELYAMTGWLIGAAGTLWIADKFGFRISDSNHVLMTVMVVAGFMALVRGGVGLRIWLRRKSLLSGKVEFVTFDRLKKLLGDTCKEGKKMWIGIGFLWTAEIANRAYYLVDRGEEDILGKKANVKGSMWMQGIGFSRSNIFVEQKHREGQSLILGTTGAGKTRLFDLMITQDILARRCVFIVDPKGDKELEANARRACEKAGKGHLFAGFHPAFPERSVRIDPLKNWNRPTELASRIAALIPGGSTDPFVQFSWGALNNIIEGIIAIGEQPTLKSIRRYLLGDTEQLLVKALSVHFDKLGIEDWESTVTALTRKYKSNPAMAYVEFNRKNLKDHQMASHLEGLIQQFEHSREHLQKMIATLMPVLSMLTSAPLDKLLSPTQSADIDESPAIDTATAIEKGMVVYLGLDSLSDPVVGSAIGSIIMSDLTAVAGDRYNYGHQGQSDCVAVYVDEAAEVINRPTIAMMNKGRGAGFVMTIATQTIADFISRLGNEADARMVLGNCNNQYILRLQDGETQQYVSENMTTVMINNMEQNLRSGNQSDDLDDQSGAVGDMLKGERLPIVSSTMFGKLPDLHFYAKLANGQIYKSKIPILKG